MSMTEAGEAILRKDVGWDEYCELPRMNGSTLVKAKKSMKELHHCMQKGGERETDKMRFGSQLHCLLLEPERFESENVVMPDFHLDGNNVTGKGAPSTSKATDYYKKAVEQFQTENAGREIISRSAYDKALCMIEAVRSHKTADLWLRKGSREVTALGEICGVPFKGRIDILVDRIVDLKATGDVSVMFFGRTSANFSYAEKLAGYRELVRQATGETLQVNVIAVEDKPPWDRVNYRYPEELLDYGFKRVQAWASTYTAAMEKGEWHGVDQGQDELEVYVPNYFMPEDDGMDWS